MDAKRYEKGSLTESVEGATFVSMDNRNHTAKNVEAQGYVIMEG
jgi:hypothetical protein